MVNMLPALLAALKFCFISSRYIVIYSKKLQMSPNLPYLKWFSVKYLPHILTSEAAVNTIRMMVCRKRAFCSVLDSLSIPVVVVVVVVVFFSGGCGTTLYISIHAFAADKADSVDIFTSSS